MRLIDEQYMKHPEFGSPRMTDWLRDQEHCVNRKRVARLMQRMGLQAITPGPHTSKPDLDNLAKLVLDRITRNGRFWGDDAQVDMLAIGKEWAKAGEAGGVLVTIRRGT